MASSNLSDYNDSSEYKIIKKAVEETEKKNKEANEKTNLDKIQSMSMNLKPCAAAAAEAEKTKADEKIKKAEEETEYKISPSQEKPGQKQLVDTWQPR